MNPKVETAVSIVELDPRGVLLWDYKRGAVVGIREAEEEARAIRGLLETHGQTRCWLLIDISKMQSIDRAARRFFASEEVHTDFGIQALALVMGSPIGTVIGNLYQAINRTLHPTRLFTTEAKANAWIDEKITQA